MKILFCLIFPLLPFLMIAQTTRISGTAPGAEGRKIEVVGWSDLVTRLEKPLAQAIVDSTASFTLSFSNSKTISVFLAIDFHQGELFIEPGKTYNISIAPLNYNEMQEVNPFVESQSLEITILENKPDELNALIQAFNKEYNVFVLENFNLLYQEKDKARLDTFRVKMMRKFHDVKQSYFNDYVRYKLGSLEQVANVMGKSPMVKKYFYDSQILYDNVEYMDFFDEFFSKYITAASRPLKFLNYSAMIDGPNSYAALMKALETDTLLRRPQLRELVLLRNLMEMWDDPAYKQPGIGNVLSLIHISEPTRPY